jgi:hypothetical protein
MAPRTPTVRFHARPVVIVLAVFGGLFTTSLAAALSNVLGGASAAWIVGCLVTCFWLRIVSCHIGVGSRVVVIANALHTYRIPLNRITAITYEFRPTLGYVLSIARDDGRSFASLFRRARNPMAPFSLVFAGVMLVNVTVNIEALHRTGVGAVAISSLAIGALVLSVFAIV